MPWRDNYNQIKFDFLLFHNKKININEIISNLNKNSKEYILNCNIKINECENNKLNELFNEKKLITKLKIETIFNKKTFELSPESYYYLEYIDEFLYNIKEKYNIKIFDLIQSKEIEINKLKPNFPNFKNRIEIHKIKKKDRYQLHTHGLNKFSIPDLQINNIKKEEINDFKKIIIETATNLLISNKTKLKILNKYIILEFMSNSKEHFDKPQLKIIY